MSASTLRQHVAETIRSLRCERRWTQKDVADRVRVSTNTVSRWETGTYRPTVENVYDLAIIFRVPVSMFFPAQGSLAPFTQVESVVAGLDARQIAAVGRFARWLRWEKANAEADSPPRCDFERLAKPLKKKAGRRG